MKGTEDSEMGKPWLTGHPQVPPRECVSAIPRSAVLDAAFPSPVATPVRVIPVSGSASRGHTASVS